MIDRATIDRIIDAVRIEEVIGEFVSLRRRGANYLGLCPFHQDKNPSMSVSSTKGIFKCFSCGKAGTAVSFLMEHEHITYPEALKYLAKKYGIEIIEEEEDPQQAAKRLKYESLLVVSEYAQKFYQDILWNNEFGRAIGYSYFKERKFTDETIKKFGLGYAHNRPVTLSAEALKAGYKKEFLVETGLCIERENGTLADRFYDRVMFPIHSVSGRVIAFGGRTLKSDKSVAKYVNSPETEIYNKSRSLYGIFFAKSAIGKNDKCFLVEGYTDVISMHQAGIENVVASSGTALTVEQIRLIKRFTDKVTVIYDGDEAGIKASIRGIDLILEEGMLVKVVLLPQDEDPDSFAKAHTREEILDFIEKHESDFITYKTDLLSKEINNDPIRKAQLINDIIGTVAVIPDPVLRNVYTEMVSERFEQRIETIYYQIEKVREKKKRWKAAQAERMLTTTQFSGTSSTSVPHDAYPPVGEEYIPPAEDYLPQEGYNPQSDYASSGGEQAQSAPRKRLITNRFLAVYEKEIIYYLIKFGCYPIHFEEDMKYGSNLVAEQTVAQFVALAMAEDDTEFENPIYKEIYNAFYALLPTLDATDHVEQQEKVLRYFTNHEEQSIVEEVLNIVYQPHQITVKEYKNAIVPEPHLLGVTVPKAILTYKKSLIEQALISISKEITKAQNNGEIARQKDLIKNLQILNKMKMKLVKELGSRR